MNRDALEKLSKDELVELVLKLQRPLKTSRTSSKPPSTDRKAKRENAKPGGAKPGHKGHHRRLADHPDQTFDHRPVRCPNCGIGIASDVASEIIGEYDRIDLPPIRPLIERHRRLACTCPDCGARVKAAVPEAATGSPFGPSIAAMAFYLKHLHHVSFQRLERLFADMFGLAISQGALCNLLQRGGARFETQKAELLTRLR
jgi:transposase